MPKQFIQFKHGEQLASLTALCHDTAGENVIRTTIVNSVRTSSDPGETGLLMGHAVKGSIKPIFTEDGSVALQVRPFRPIANPVAVPENLHSTEHGRLYRTSRKTRVIFEFPLNTPFDRISDALDDEVYELRKFLDNSD